MMVAPSTRPLEITTYSGEPDARWDEYIGRSDEATGYHRAAWAGAIHRGLGREPRYLVAERDGEVLGVLPLVLFDSRWFGRFIVSMPFLNYGGVVAESPEVEAALLHGAIAEAKRARAAHLELRHTRQHFPHLPARRHKVAMRLALRRTVDEQWKVLDRKVRNQVRKAEKNGLQAEIGREELLPAFYDVFARNMRDLGTPVYPPRFFREILLAFPDAARIFCVRQGPLPLAASLVFWDREMIEVPWASSLRSYNPLCANVLLYWEMLRFAIERGFATFDFGRSTPHEGTYEFKRQWGAEPQPLVWEYWLAEGRTLPDLSPANGRFAPAIAVWRRLPVGFTRALGPLIVRNIP
jgi:serine/alanine adding enzyme